MKRLLPTAAVAGMAIALAACGSNETATENQAPATNEAGAMAEDPNNPFAQA